jgi:rhodanese-related sulfurtransferase
MAAEDVPRLARSSFCRALLQAAAIGAVGGLLGLLHNATRAGGISLGGAAASGACGAQAAVPAPITVAEAGALLGHQGVVFIDVRPDAAYAQAHIAGAVRLPVGTPSAPAVAPLLGARTAIVYGQGADVEQVAARLASLGCRQVRVLAGGMERWLAQALPAQSGAGP